MQVEELSKTAELNFCEACYQKYKMLIEPAIKRILASPLAGWPETEVLLTSIIWKELKAYDYGTTVLLDFDFDEVNSLPEKVDRELMLKTKKWPFTKKLKFLKRRKIIGPNTYQLFEEGRKSRNKIHKLSYDFTERDLELFRVCSNVASQLSMAFCHQNMEPKRFVIRENLEEYCKQILKRINAQQID